MLTMEEHLELLEQTYNVDDVTTNVYDVDDEEATAKQLWSRSWLYEHSATDEYVRSLCNIKEKCKFITDLPDKKRSDTYIKPMFEEPKSYETTSVDPPTFDAICTICNHDTCSCSRNNINIQHDDIWNLDSFLTADHVMIQTDSLIGNGPLQLDTCVFTPGYRGLTISNSRNTLIKHIKFFAFPGGIKFMAISHIVSEEWFSVGMSLQLRHRIYAAAKYINATHVWIDTICLRPTNRHRQLESMGKLYHLATAVCVISREIISENSTLWESKWMKRAWTLQEGYNAKQLIILTNLSRNAGIIVSKPNHIPGNLRGLVLRRVPVCVAEGMAMLCGRDMSNHDDISYVLTSLLGRRSFGSLFGTERASLLMAIMVIGAIITLVILYVFARGGRWIYQFNLVTIAKYLGIALACCFSLALTSSVIYSIRKMTHIPVEKWMDMDGVLDREKKNIGTSILLMSPDPNCHRNKCWYPGIFRQHHLETTAVLSMCFAGHKPKASLPIPFSSLNKIGIKIEGKLLDKSQTLEFVEYLNVMENWLWIKDAKRTSIKAMENEDIRVVLCVNENSNCLYWMSFGFVNMKKSVGFREERFWILPVSRLTSYYFKDTFMEDYRIGYKMHEQKW